jgi:hypothetical protein
MEVSGQLHAPAALHPRKQPPEPIEQETGWAPEPVWTLCRRNNACSVGPFSSSLCRLSYRTNMKLKSSEGCCKRRKLREESIDSDDGNDDDFKVMLTPSRKLEVAVNRKELSKWCKGRKLLLRKRIPWWRGEKNVVSLMWERELTVSLFQPLEVWNSRLPTWVRFGVHFVGYSSTEFPLY